MLHRYFLCLLLLISTALSLDPNLCDSKKTMQCDDYATCCMFNNGQHGCCPFIGGICCPGQDSCCPPGFTCSDDGCVRA